MKEMRDQDGSDSPLKIIKLPTATAPILFMSNMPQTLRDLGLHSKNFIMNSPEMRNKNIEQNEQFEFHDVNEDYEGLRKINKQTEMRLLARCSLQNDITTSIVDNSKNETNHVVASPADMDGIVRLDQFVNLKRIEGDDHATAETVPDEVPAGPQSEENDNKFLDLQWKRHNKIYKAKLIEPGFDPYHSQRED